MVPMPVDPTQPIPLYHQVKTHLVDEILAGRYRPGDRIPTEHELCERFGISRTPVHRALSDLADEGVILRQRKRGSFVNPHWVRRPALSHELRMVLPEGPWEELATRAADETTSLNIATVHLDDLRSTLLRRVAEGRAPDLALVDSVWIAEMAAAGFLWPLEELDAEWVQLDYLADFHVPLHEVNMYRGQTYGVQAEADIAGVWFRRDHLDMTGCDPPADWSALVEAASEVRSALGPGHTAIVLPGGPRAGEATTYCLLALLASNGVRMMTDEAVVLDDPRTVATLRWLRDLVTRGLIPVDVVGFDRDRPAQMLGSGAATFMFGGSYQAGLLADLVGTDIASVLDEFGFIPVPAGPDGAKAVLAGGMAYVILRQGERPKEAMGFLEQLLSDDPLSDLAERTGQIPPRVGASDKAGHGIPLVAETSRMLEYAVVRPPIVEHARVSSQLQNMLTSVLTGTLGPATAAERTAEFIGAITGRPVVYRVRTDSG